MCAALQPFYGLDKPRSDTYREMVEAMLAEVRLGRRVCGVFYGHPGGLRAGAPHRAIAQARREGFEARMEPGISAEDCLYADLGIDPGTVGCQHYEASQFMFFQRRIDPTTYLILWQIGHVGDRTLRRTATGPAYRRLLVDKLLHDYPATHAVIVYEAAALPMATARVEEMALSYLVESDLYLQSRLVIPPAGDMQRDEAMFDRIAQLDRAAAGS
jgi:hypothetical protein